ncbi:coiled-coil domain-containing protein 170 [Protopterus annectens]|uniref:coiled-coil domain-containing protein 170 n=1 Tax=Protopterus annectens TaxID=7888 RepID=UPI001CF9D823|nr:coiled-coil domain-containing protein 170 [Protopterus annectens]
MNNSPSRLDPGGIRMIDVNSNSALRSFSPVTSGIRSASEGAYDPVLVIPVTREQLNHYRAAAETARSELAALQVKHQCIQAELLDIQSRLSAKETLVQELKAEVEGYKENNARQTSLLTSLRERLQETEEETGALAGYKTRAEVTVQAAKKENQELKERIQELEVRHRRQLTEWEDSRQNISNQEKKYTELIFALAKAINVDLHGKANPQELLISKIAELQKEDTSQKCKIVSLSESISAYETECKASRETIMRLVSEVGREQKAAMSYKQELDAVHKDLDSSLLAKNSLEREVRLLQERLEANQRAWDASKQELGNLERQTSELNGSLKSSLYESKAVESMFQSFKQQLATSLSSGNHIVSPDEDAIKERICEMCRREESKKMMVSKLEDQISRLTEELGNQSELHKSALQRAAKAEQQLETIRERQHQLEGEVVSKAVQYDSLNIDKQKYLKFLDLLSSKMKLEEVAADIGFDMRIDVIVARAEQLVKLEADALLEKKSLAQNLQRKLKTQKEKLESKELHMDLLRKKIAQLEEEKQTRTALAVERDEANLTVRKLQKKVERLQKELNVAQTSNTEIKAKLADTNELKVKTLEQNKVIGDLSKSLDRLEKVKEKAGKQLANLKSELSFTEQEAKEEKERARSMLEMVTNELKILKQTLVEVARREKQLVDFREVVSQMLGLNINALALPDYEIVKRLEKLIQNHHCHAVNCLHLEKPVEALHHGCLPGHSIPSHILSISP